MSCYTGATNPLHYVLAQLQRRNFHVGNLRRPGVTLSYTQSLSLADLIAYVVVEISRTILVIIFASATTSFRRWLFRAKWQSKLSTRDACFLYSRQSSVWATLVTPLTFNPISSWSKRSNFGFPLTLSRLISFCHELYLLDTIYYMFSFSYMSLTVIYGFIYGR